MGNTTRAVTAYALLGAALVVIAVRAFSDDATTIGREVLVIAACLVAGAAVFWAGRSGKRTAPAAVGALIGLVAAAAEFWERGEWWTATLAAGLFGSLSFGAAMWLASLRRQATGGHDRGPAS